MNFSKRVLIAAALLTLVAESLADEPPRGARLEITLNLQNWSALSDLQPMAGGGFNDLGLGVAAAAHWPWKQLSNSELLVGLDAGIVATTSNTFGVYGDLSARRMFVAPSLKWVMGDTGRFAVDAGVGWHLLDIADVPSGYGTIGAEVQYWEETTIAPFLGASWDFRPAENARKTAFTAGLRVHFVDFGDAHDETTAFQPALGPAAGELAGPLIVLRLGAAWR